MAKNKLIIFCALGGMIALGVMALKTVPTHLGPEQKALDDRFAINALNSFMPDHYQAFFDALEESKPIPKNYELYYRMAVKFRPRDFAGHYLLALCYQSRGALEEADAAYQKSIKLNPGFFWAYYNLGLLYWQNGHQDVAIKIWSIGIQLPPPLTLHLLTASKLLSDCVGDLASRSPNANQSILKGYEDVAQWIAKRQIPQDSHPVLF